MYFIRSWIRSPFCSLLLFYNQEKGGIACFSRPSASQRAHKGLIFESRNKFQTFHPILEEARNRIQNSTVMQTEQV